MPYTLAFTLRDGRLELDEGHGPRDGLRVVDPRARAFFYADGRALPFDAFGAVAVVYVEELVRRHVTGGSSELVPARRHVIVLVPRAPGPEVESVLAAASRGDPRPQGSLWIASDTVAAASVRFFATPGAAVARREAKAIAEVAGLAMVELYGEVPVFRPAGQLDESLVEALGARGPQADPGPPPAGVRVTDEAGDLVVTLPARGPSKRLAYGVVAALCVGGAAAIALDVKLGLAILAHAALAAIVLLPAASSKPSRLVVGARSIAWRTRDGGDEIAVADLERVRVADDGTLVLVGRRDEVRCPVGGPAAEWARAAIHHRLGPRAPGYRG